MKKIIYMPLPTVAYFLLSILIERALERRKLDQGFQINNNKAVRINCIYFWEASEYMPWKPGHSFL